MRIDANSLETHWAPLTIGGITLSDVPMSEPDSKSQREQREFEGKNIAHYSVLLQAWVDTRMESDKTIVTLAAAGVGLLVSILAAAGVKHRWEIFLYGGAFISLGLSIYISLEIFRRNSRHIALAIHGSSEEDPALIQYDKAQMAAFLVGVCFFAIIGIVTAFNSVAGDSAMNDQSKFKQTPGPLTGDSVNGIGRLAPQEPLGKSLSGVGSLRPQAPVTPAASAPASQASQPATNSPAAGTTQSTSTGK